ncbi:MAG: hypothetical protein AAF460_07610 [Pseudomonadota bacterium]
MIRKPGTALDADQITAHCAARMARFMVPEQVAFLENFPRTVTGKPEKGKLATL